MMPWNRFLESMPPTMLEEMSMEELRRVRRVVAKLEPWIPGRMQTTPLVPDQFAVHIDGVEIDQRVVVDALRFFERRGIVATSSSMASYVISNV